MSCPGQDVRGVRSAGRLGSAAGLRASLRRMPSRQSISLRRVALGPPGPVWSAQLRTSCSGTPPDISSRICLTFFTLLLSSSLSWGEAGRTGAAFLRKPIGARAASLGEAYAAVAEDVYALGFNPASLGRLAAPAFSSTYLQGIAEDHYGFVGYGHPLGWGTLALGAVYFNAGEIELNLSNGIREKRTAEEDLLGMLSYSRRILPGIWLGGTGKWMRLELAEEAHATLAAADVGLLIQPPWLPQLSLGASLQNLGPEVRYEEEGDPLPRTARVGAALALSLDTFWPWEELQKVRLLLVTDGVQVREEDFAARMGLEVGIQDQLADLDWAALRFGYQPDRDLDAFSAGLGFVLGRYQLDYAFHLVEDLRNTHQISFGLRF